MIKLQPHQEDQLKLMIKHNKGILTAPTGTGKTHPMAFVTAHYMKTEEAIVTVVKFPRIQLISQQINVFNSILNQELSLKQYPYQLMIHSGHDKEFINYEEMNESLKTGEIDIKKYKELEKKILKENCGVANIEALSLESEIVQKLKSLSKNKNIIIYTTYHSFNKVNNILEKCNLRLYLELNDEAQYMVEERFFKKSIAKKQFFVTATLKSQVESWIKEETGRGMKNKEMFGDIIYSLSPNEAIKKNLIVPIIHKWIRLKNKSITPEEINKNTYQVVNEAVKDLKTHFKIGNKLLVSVGNKRQLRNIIKKSQYFTKKNIELLTIHSDSNLTTYNGNIISRKEFEYLKTKLGNDLDTKLIIAHYDILSEGIDIPGMLGVLILRNLSESKSFQTIGRVVRLIRSNPKLKPYGVVYTPDYDIDTANNQEEQIRKWRKEGYISIEQFTPINRSGDAHDIPSSEPGGISKYIDLQMQVEIEQEERIKKFYKSVKKSVPYSIFN